MIEDHPQWDISDDEEEKEYNDNISEDSDYSTDEYDLDLGFLKIETFYGIMVLFAGKCAPGSHVIYECRKRGEIRSWY